MRFPRATHAGAERASHLGEPAKQLELQQEDVGTTSLSGGGEGSELDTLGSPLGRCI